MFKGRGGRGPVVSVGMNARCRRVNKCFKTDKVLCTTCRSKEACSRGD
jgi:hypothetical protein